MRDSKTLPPITRRRALVAAALIAVTAGATTAQQPQPQGQGDSAAQAAARLVRLIGLAKQDGYSLRENTSAFGGGLLRRGDANWVPAGRVSLRAGGHYRFLAAGDFNAVDVDLQVRNEDGWLVASDTTASPEAVVEYAPTRTGSYLLRLRLRACRGDAPGVCLAAVLEK